jgi:3-oxoadipate enol-lactonase
VTTPVVLLHPLGADHRFWDPVRAALPDTLGPVLVPDLLGHGQAALPERGAGVEEFADELEKALSSYDRAHVVGVSLGGLVAQVLAARRPDLVERVVLADTVAVYPPAMRDMWEERAATVRREGIGAVAGPLEALWFTPGFRQTATEEVAAVREMLLDTDPEGYARTCEALAKADTSGVVADITAPVLAACGLHDAAPFRAATEWFGKSLAGTRVVWLRGGHATAYEHPREFADLLLDFLTETQPRP